MPSSRRIQKINKHIQRTFGEVLLQEADLPPDVLVTIARVDTTLNLKSTTVWLYVLPVERAEAVLVHLTPQLYELQGAFNRILDIHPLPRLRLRIDYGAQHAETIERRLAELKEPPDKTTPESPGNS